MAKKVNLVRFQTALEMPGIVGQIGNVLPSPNKTLNDLEMTVDGEVLDVKFTHNKLGINLLVPLTNVIYMRAVPEDKKPSKQ